jgi:hypothetical protein
MEKNCKESKNIQTPGKLDFLTDDWVEVSWISLTEPNQTHHRHLIKDTKKFIKGLSERVGCHIAFIWGLMGIPNTHLHGAICVPRHELDEYKERIKKVLISKLWLFRDYHFEEWEEGHDTYAYILEKHFPQEVIWECPRRYARCKKSGSGCTDKIVR